MSMASCVSLRPPLSNWTTSNAHAFVFNNSGNGLLLPAGWTAFLTAPTHDGSRTWHYDLVTSQWLEITTGGRWIRRTPLMSAVLWREVWPTPRAPGGPSRRETHQPAVL